jgi:hypothetical protein
MDDPDSYYCLPFVDRWDLYRAFLLAHPDAVVEWFQADDGLPDIAFDHYTERIFRRWHHSVQEAAIVPCRGILWMNQYLGPGGWALV